MMRHSRKALQWTIWMLMPLIILRSCNLTRQVVTDISSQYFISAEYFHMPDSNSSRQG
ncbi:hypothetical protein PAXRUDRAFT_428356 [Paxillus rubicundulus Ve08.2h10]|uniref:Uncharacterized protein n=1 Tax=Paxillus rubicundulus Ve08.2h10 TaxID=930991 RepID=A0A0D0DXE1_9AGAM|nr:hypothetical protein PAXRUDRAFT_428356 [Paxillus rubicundulus Ve08.2h10]